MTDARWRDGASGDPDALLDADDPQQYPRRPGSDAVAASGTNVYAPWLTRHDGLTHAEDQVAAVSKWAGHQPTSREVRHSLGGAASASRPVVSAVAGVVVASLLTVAWWELRVEADDTAGVVGRSRSSDVVELSTQRGTADRQRDGHRETSTVVVPNLTPTTVALWNMDGKGFLSAGHDASGNALHADVGSEVTPGVVASSSQGLRFPWVHPNNPPTTPGHLVTVPDAAALDPGRRTYSVTIRYRTTRHFGNLIQKGQATTPGGFWKLQQPKGVLQCLFRGSAGQQATVTSGSPLNDGEWHEVTCERTSRELLMVVDGGVTDVQQKRTGRVANSMPLTIGGKSSCDQVTVGCDYFIGTIDFVRLERS